MLSFCAIQEILRAKKIGILAGFIFVFSNLSENSEKDPKEHKKDYLSVSWKRNLSLRKSDTFQKRRLKWVLIGNILTDQTELKEKPE